LKLKQEEESEIIRYLESGHSYRDTVKKFNINQMRIARLKQKLKSNPDLHNSSYQEKIWQLQQQIFVCPLLDRKQKGSCIPDLNGDALKARILPDYIFVGNKYGQLQDIPKILFIGNNPNSDASYFGTLSTIHDIFPNTLEKITAAEYFHKVFGGDENAGYSGFKDFKMYTNPIWSIKKLLSELFPGKCEVIEAFALTNSVLCKGNGDSGAPTGCLRENCLNRQNWLQKTISILEPDLIFVFSVGNSDSTWSWLSTNRIPEFQVTEMNFSSDVVKKLRWDFMGQKGSSLMVAIPHLSDPRFQTWTRGIPNIFRGLFFLQPENIVKVIIKEIKRYIQLNGGTTMFWKILANVKEVPELIDEYLNDGFISIGFETGDLSEYQGDGEQMLDPIKQKLIDSYPDENWNVEDQSLSAKAGVVNSFINRIQISDYIILFDARNRTLHIGQVQSPYEYDGTRSERIHQHIRRINWMHTYPWDELTRDERNGMISQLTLNQIRKPASIRKLQWIIEH
jgi:hypothetical protein